MIRVLIAEDQLLVRQGIRALLDKAKDIEIVGEARDGLDAVTLSIQTSPDVVLMDVSMPNLDGFEALDAIHNLHLNVKILILSMYVDQELVQKALQHRVHGYLLKDCSRLELLSAIRAVYQSRPFFSSAALLYFSSSNPPPS